MVILMKNSEIIVIYQDVGKMPELQKIKNDVNELEKILERKNRRNTIQRYSYCL